MCSGPAPRSWKIFAIAKQLSKGSKQDGLKGKRHGLRKGLMNIGAWNIQGIRNKQQEVFKEMNDRMVDIAILSETKKKGAGCERSKYYTHYFSGVDKSERAKCGISIIIRRKLEKRVKCWEHINERIIKLTLTIQGRIINIIGIYAPNDDASTASKDLFANDLKQILDEKR